MLPSLRRVWPLERELQFVTWGSIRVSIIVLIAAEGPSATLVPTLISSPSVAVCSLSSVFSLILSLYLQCHFALF